ncbi:unnamed protein product [Paramecium sonneborni]|uniref:Uncharacterized protein n=1 Tax=Paramecium sonneborni TaxID=65129 RepID=A0A8S1RTV1_9CILI|nr:unnamed protein product [Paramecium sonneborni]
MMRLIINCIVIVQMDLVFVKHYYKRKQVEVRSLFNMWNIMMKIMISMSYNPLSKNSINHYYIIHKSQQSQLIVLLVNKPQEEFLNFYEILENKQVIQSDSDIEQFQNPKDGIQLITFSNLQNKRDILQLIACLPKLKMDSIEQMYVLTPNSIERYQLPQLPQEQGALYPYFWILGSLKESYEVFDVVNQIINTEQSKTYPNLTKSHKNPLEAAQCAFQSPNLIVATNVNGSVIIWNLDSYLIDSTINCQFSDCVNTIIIWDDDNVMISDNAGGMVVWLKKDDETQQFILLQIEKLIQCVKQELKDQPQVRMMENQYQSKQIQSNFDSSTQTIDPIKKMISITNDQIAFLCDNSKSIFIYKIEKSLDKPLSGTLIKQVIIKGCLRGGQPILQIISLDQHYLILGGLDGVLQTLSIDTLEKGPNISLHSNQQVNSVFQNENEDGVLIAQDSHFTFVYSPETANELKITHQKYFQSPVQLYQGEGISQEKRLLLFTKQGKMVVWSLQDKVFPDISNFLMDNEFPHKLKPVDRQYLLVDAKISKENFSVYLITENGEIIKDSNKLIKFERIQTFKIMSFKIKAIQLTKNQNTLMNLFLLINLEQYIWRSYITQIF